MKYSSIEGDDGTSRNRRQSELENRDDSLLALAHHIVHTCSQTLDRGRSSSRAQDRRSISLVLSSCPPVVRSQETDAGRACLPLGDDERIAHGEVLWVEREG